MTAEVETFRHVEDPQEKEENPSNHERQGGPRPRLLLLLRARRHLQLDPLRLQLRLDEVGSGRLHGRQSRRGRVPPRRPPVPLPHRRGEQRAKLLDPLPAPLERSSTGSDGSSPSLPLRADPLVPALVGEPGLGENLLLQRLVPVGLEEILEQEQDEEREDGGESNGAAGYADACCLCHAGESRAGARLWEEGAVLLVEEGDGDLEDRVEDEKDAEEKLQALAEPADAGLEVEGKENRPDDDDRSQRLLLHLRDAGEETEEYEESNADEDLEKALGWREH
eukprot:756582-Hanusia_phi.AAC.1